MKNIIQNLTDEAVNDIIDRLFPLGISLTVLLAAILLFQLITVILLFLLRRRL